MGRGDSFYTFAPDFACRKAHRIETKPTSYEKNTSPARRRRNRLGRIRRRLPGKQLLGPSGRHGQRRHGDETRCGVDLLQPGGHGIPGVEIQHLRRCDGYPFLRVGLDAPLDGKRLRELAHGGFGQQNVHPAAHVHQLQTRRALGRGPGFLHPERLLDELGRQLVGIAPHPADQPRGLHLPAHRLVQDLRPSLRRRGTDAHVGQLRPVARHAAHRRRQQDPRPGIQHDRQAAARAGCGRRPLARGDRPIPGHGPAGRDLLHRQPAGQIHRLGQAGGQRQPRRGRERRHSLGRDRRMVDRHELPFADGHEGR